METTISPNAPTSTATESTAVTSDASIAAKMTAMRENSRSLIALFPKKEIILDDLKNFQEALEPNEKWFGYISYEHANNLETLPITKKSFIDLPKIWLLNFNLTLEFDHDKKTLEAYFSKQEQLDEILKYKEKQNLFTKPLRVL